MIVKHIVVLKNIPINIVRQNETFLFCCHQYALKHSFGETSLFHSTIFVLSLFVCSDLDDEIIEQEIFLRDEILSVLHESDSFKRMR